MNKCRAVITLSTSKGVDIILQVNRKAEFVIGSKRSSKCVSTLQLLFLMLKKFLHLKFLEDPKKYHALDNCPAPVKTNITSLTCSGFQRFYCDFAVNRQVKSMNSV